MQAVSSSHQIYSTIGEIRWLYRHIKSNFPAYLEHSNLSLCFFFEEIVSYDDEKVVKQGQNLNRGERWGSGVIKRVRVLLPSPYTKSQVYFTKTGVGIHGQKTLLEIFEILQGLQHFPPHTFIWNHEDYSDGFMRVINIFPNQNFITLPDPERVRQCAFENVSKDKNGIPQQDANGNYMFKSTTKGRAKLATDLGVTTETANRRGLLTNDDGTTNHHSRPPMTVLRHLEPPVMQKMVCWQLQHQKELRGTVPPSFL